MALEKDEGFEELAQDLENIINTEKNKEHREFLQRIISQIYNTVLGEEKTKSLLNKLVEGDGKFMMIEVIQSKKSSTSYNTKTATIAIILELCSLYPQTQISKKKR